MKKFLWRLVGIIYMPIFLAFFLLHKIARILLAIAYFGMLERRMAVDILKHIFDFYDRRKV